jgi:tetratricopeptide (TPR) repeat protein
MRRFIAAALTLVLAVGSASGQTFIKPKAKTGPSGTRRALVVGISTYDSIPQLAYAARDAQAFAAFLRSPAGFVAPGNIRLLVNDSATARSIYSGLEWLKRASQPGDEAIIYFAGHGDVEGQSGRERGFLLAYDARAGRYYAGGTVRISDLQDDFAVGILKQGVTSVLLITDACRSGKLVGGALGARQTTAALMQEWDGVTKLVSSGPYELSREGPEWGEGHGIFTYYLIAALNGRADADSDNVVTLEEVARFVRDSVAGRTGKNQVPRRSGDTEWAIAWVQDSARHIVVTGGPGAPDHSRDPAPDPAVQRSLAAFQRALAAGLVFDSAGAWDIYRRELANTTAGADARFALIAVLEEKANAALSEYLSGANTQTTSGESRQAASGLELAAQLVGETSIRSPRLLARRLFFEGYAYAQKRDYASALQSLRRSINLEPEPAYAYNARGFAFLGDQQLDSAWQTLSAARARAPRLAYPILGMALVALEVGDPRRAIGLIDSGATLTGPQAALQVARAIALVDLDRRAAAAEVFRAAVMLDPALKRAPYVPEALRDMPKAVARLERLRMLAGQPEHP